MARWQRKGRRGMAAGMGIGRSWVLLCRPFRHARAAALAAPGTQQFRIRHGWRGADQGVGAT